MKARTYKLFAQSELAHIQSRLSDIARQWTKSWIMEEHIPAMTVTACEHAHAIHERHQHQDFKWHLATSSERHWVAITQGDDGAHGVSNILSGRLIGGNGYNNHDSVLAVNLTQKFLHDLAESVIKQAPCNLGKNAHSHSDSAESLPAETWAYGSGAICAEISMRGMTIVLIISPELTSNYLSIPALVSKTSRPLTPLKQAIGPVRIELEAGIGSATLSLGELRHMAVGDVIRLDTRLAQPIQVSLNRQIACAGFLGAHRGNKAVLLKSLTS